MGKDILSMQFFIFFRLSKSLIIHRSNFFSCVAFGSLAIQVSVVDTNLILQLFLCVSVLFIHNIKQRDGAKL